MMSVVVFVPYSIRLYLVTYFDCLSFVILSEPNSYTSITIMLFLVFTQPKLLGLHV